MITLGGVELSESLIWSDRRAWSPVLQTVRMTVGGGLNIFSESSRIQRPVTLFANENQGWLTLGMVEGLQLLLSNANQSYIFNFHDLEIELGSWFIGTIKLFSV